LQGEDYEAEVAKAGFDYNFVNYYAAGGQRSRRLGGILQKVLKLWGQITDPDDDAMFLASLKQADARKGIDYGFTERTDPPFVWFEQRECYDKDWHPGRDFEICKKAHVDTLPAIRLYAFDEKTGRFSKEYKEFDGPRTLRGIIKWLAAETDWEKVRENIKRFEQIVLGSDGAGQLGGKGEAPITSQVPKLPAASAGAVNDHEPEGVLAYAWEKVHALSDEIFGQKAGEEDKVNVPLSAGVEVATKDAATKAVIEQPGVVPSAAATASVASDVNAATKSAAMPLPILFGIPPYQPGRRLALAPRAPSACSAASFL